MPTGPVFTRAKIKSRFGILVNLPSQYDAQQIIAAAATAAITNTYMWYKDGR